MIQRTHLFKISAILLAVFSSCSEDAPDADCSAANLDLTIENVTDAACNEENGSVTVSGTGGSGAYMYSINGSSPSESGVFNGLGSGVFTLTVTDEAGCSAEKQATVNDQSSLTFTVSVTAAGCETSNGSIVLTASGGQPPYMYRLGNGNFQTEGAFTNLAAGSFDVVVRDDNGCQFTGSAHVASGLSLAADIKPIIQNNCAIAGCHVGGALPDFRNSATIVANASNIRTMTQTRAMPPAGSGKQLSQEQIDRIACWVGDGAPNN